MVPVVTKLLAGDAACLPPVLTWAQHTKTRSHFKNSSEEGFHTDKKAYTTFGRAGRAVVGKRQIKEEEG